MSIANCDRCDCRIDTDFDEPYDERGRCLCQDCRDEEEDNDD